jgi:transposase
MTDQDGDLPKTARRMKRWAIGQKCRIVEETFVPGASVASVARRNNVNANQLFEWRKQYRQGTLLDRKAVPGEALATPDLLRIGVIDQDGGICAVPVSNHVAPPAAETSTVPALPVCRTSGIVEIDLGNGIRVRADAGIDELALRRVLAAARELA